jgi:anti-sigma factor RsiW
MNNPHLSTEQLYDLLDKPTHASGTHLHTCAACRQELITLRSSLDNFRIAATNLAAAELPQLAPRRAEPVNPVRLAFRRQIFAATFATAAVLLAASVTLIHPWSVTPVKPVINSVQQPAATDSDAALLDGIQQDLDASVPQSLAPLEVAPANSSLDHQD